MVSFGARIGKPLIKVRKCHIEYTFYSEISINISGNIGPKITASLTIQSLTMTIVQIDNGVLWFSYWLTAHQGP